MMPRIESLAVILMVINLMHRFDFTHALMVEDKLHGTANLYSTPTSQVKSHQNYASNSTPSRFILEDEKNKKGKFNYYERSDTSEDYGKCNRAKRSNPHLCDKRVYQINCPETCFVPTLTPSVPPSSAPTSCRDRKKSFETNDDPRGFGKCKRARRDTSLCSSLDYQLNCPMACGMCESLSLPSSSPSNSEEQKTSSVSKEDVSGKFLVEGSLEGVCKKAKMMRDPELCNLEAYKINCPKTCPITPYPSLVPSISQNPTLSPSDAPTISKIPTSIPSDTPSEMPSDTPSENPTIAPSSEPSDELSISPSMSPSDEPSFAPSEEPTIVPSSKPSDEPSISPSISPSDEPSFVPSEVPTVVPSSIPSMLPSKSPTFHPSYTPSMMPSEDPTMFPSISVPPSSAPTVCHDTKKSFKTDDDPNGFGKCKRARRDTSLCVSLDYQINCPMACGVCESLGLPSSSPSHSPVIEQILSDLKEDVKGKFVVEGSLEGVCKKAKSMRDPELCNLEAYKINCPKTCPISPYPTLVPSEVPTISDIPTSIPSDTPSDIPSDTPSDIPSDTPSDTPSDIPSDTPSEDPITGPSSEPSDEPSLYPSNTPTTIPTFNPTIVPSMVPSDAPSFYPSNAPSSMPSITPSDSPSITPTAEPTVYPSSLPSVVPTAKPSTNPSTVPSMQPSLSPSTTPTADPSLSPSATPTSIPTLIPSSIPSVKPSLRPSAPSFAILLVPPSSAQTLSPTSRSTSDSTKSQTVGVDPRIAGFTKDTHPKGNDTSIWTTSFILFLSISVIIFFSIFIAKNRDNSLQEVSEYSTFDDGDAPELLQNTAVLAKRHVNDSEENFQDSTSIEDNNEKRFRELNINISSDEKSTSSFVPTNFNILGGLSSVHNVHFCTSARCEKCYENPGVKFISTNGHRKFKRSQPQVCQEIREDDET